jgi:hypothetical protein
MTSRVETGSGNVPHIAAQKRASYAHEETSLLQDWRLLEPRGRDIVKSIMDVLLREQRKQTEQRALAQTTGAHAAAAQATVASSRRTDP